MYSNWPPTGNIQNIYLKQYNYANLTKNNKLINY